LSCDFSATALGKSDPCRAELAQIIGFGCQGVEAPDPEPSYETTPKWHSFFFVLTGRFLAGGGAEH